MACYAVLACILTFIEDSHSHLHRSLYICSLYLNQAKQCWSAGRMPSFNIMLSVLCCVVVQYRDGDLWRLWCQDSSLCRLRLTEHIQHLASSQFLKTTVATRRLAGLAPAGCCSLSQARSCFASAVSLDTIINTDHTNTSIVQLLQANYFYSLKYHHDS